MWKDNPSSPRSVYQVDNYYNAPRGWILCGRIILVLLDLYIRKIISKMFLEVG